MNPTIAELEAILKEKDVKVEILPNGEVRVVDSRPAAIIRWHKYADRGEGFEDRDPHDDDNPDYIRAAIDEALEEVAQRIENGWQIPATSPDTSGADGVNEGKYE